jgi:hypothetical protein
MGEVLTPDSVGVMMLAVNVPMACYLVWDVVRDYKEHDDEKDDSS